MSEHTAAGGPRRWTALAAAVALMVGACGGGGPRDAAVTTTTTTTNTTTIVEARQVESWVGDQLPRVASPVAVASDLAVYFTTEGTDQFVTVVDLVERRQRWRQPSHQHGRIPGVVFAPFVDVDSDRVVVTTYDDATGAVELAAFDLGSGVEQWRGPVPWAQDVPDRCVDDTLVCYTASDGATVQVDPDGGRFLGMFDGGLERLIGGVEDLVVTADPDGPRIEVGAVVAGGYERRWQRGFGDFLADPAAGGLYGPDGGWAADVDVDTGSTLFQVGALPPDDIYERPEPRLTDEEMREVIERGDLVGLAGPDGTPVLGLTNVWGCQDLPFRVEEFWTCEGIEVAERTDYDEDGTLDPEPVIHRLVRRSMAEPDGEVTVELPAPVPFFGAGIRATSDADRFVLAPTNQDTVVLDTTTPTLRPAEREDELVVQCPLPGELEADDDALMVTLDTFDGGVDEYRTVLGPFGLCDLGGAPVDVADILARNDLPGWFGIGHDAGDDDHDQELAASANGWVLWTELDRVLRVAHVSN